MVERIDSICRATAGHPGVRVLYVLNSHPLITVGPGSFIHELLLFADTAARTIYLRRRLVGIITALTGGHSLFIC